MRDRSRSQGLQRTPRRRRSPREGARFQRVRAQRSHQRRQSPSPPSLPKGRSARGPNTLPAHNPPQQHPPAPKNAPGDGPIPPVGPSPVAPRRQTRAVTPPLFIHRQTQNRRPRLTPLPPRAPPPRLHRKLQVVQVLPKLSRRKRHQPLHTRRRVQRTNVPHQTLPMHQVRFTRRFCRCNHPIPPSRSSLFIRPPALRARPCRLRVRSPSTSIGRPAAHATTYNSWTPTDLRAIHAPQPLALRDALHHHI